MINRWIFCCVFALATPVFCISATDYFEHGYQYLSPKTNSTEVSRYSTVILRFQEISPFTVSNLDDVIRLIDEKGRVHSGRIHVASDDKTIIFKPVRPFEPGEKIEVDIRPDFSASKIQPIHYSFTVSKAESRNPDQRSEIQSLHKSGRTLGKSMIMPNGVSVPGDFPYIDVRVNGSTADGYIFINNWGDSHYNMILENDGSPVWYQRTPDERRDMKVQKNGLMSMLVRQGYPFGQGFVALDHTYAEVDSFFAVEGYSTDEHELQVLENGHYILFGLRMMTVDMSGIVAGGKKNAQVSESGFQEFTPEGDLIFQWRAWDNFSPRDMIGYSPDDQPTDYSFRFPHMNSIDIDDDGHYILSSKRLSEVTKINRQTSEIIWRLGGANNEFEFIGDPLNGFYNQHSVRVLGNGHYTIFDNGCLHNPPVSRALEYEIDTGKMTATLVWSYVENPPTYAFHMGNVQRLPNGNTLINWAVENLPKAQEITPDGRIAYEMNFVDRFKTYRSFRFPWNGIASRPNLIVEPQADNITLLFNKFGDPDVDYYNIYVDRRYDPRTLVATSKETLYRLTDVQNSWRYYIKVSAVDKQGRESDFSNVVSMIANLIKPGEELVQNSGFDLGKDSWDCLARNGAVADWSVEDGVAHIAISNSGPAEHDIQLTQAGLSLVQGRSYIFEFDAWAANPRTAEIKIAQNGDLYTDYSRLGPTSLGRSRKRYEYRFIMQNQSDSDARIVFNLGQQTVDVFIDNVSLKMEGDTLVKDKVPALAQNYELYGNYPNPFNARTRIRFSLPKQSDIRIVFFDVLGRIVKEVTRNDIDAGLHNVVFDGATLPSGLYFYMFEARAFDGGEKFRQSRKLMLIK